MLEVIKFGADWCGPCRMLKPTLEKVMSEYSDIKFTDVNVDENRDLSATYGVRSIPVVFIEKDGEIVDKFVGVKSESEIKEILNKHI